jgi:hypothetical protein
MSVRLSMFTLLLLAACHSWAIAQDQQQPSTETPSADEAAAEVQPSEAELFKKFEQTMAGARLTGKFTVVGREASGLKEETYEIKSVQKLDQGDFWLFKARIKYGEHDVVVPMPLEVKWAGDTPVITLTDTTIPGLGTFSARVVIHNDWYAGTWVHGPVGGHLFGTISREQAPTE